MARVWVRLLRDRNVIVGGGIVLLMTLASLAAPWLTDHDPVANDLANVRQPPSPEHWLGTDGLGRDIFARVLYGGRLSILVGVFSVGIALAIGVPIGLTAGYFGGRWDAIAMRVVDIVLAFPGMLLAILIVSVLGPSLYNAMFAVAIASVPIYARLTRASVLATRGEDYVEAARAAGMSHARIMFRHILPNCLSPLIVQSTLRVATAILTASALSFLGLGAQPPTPEWGAMVSEGRSILVTSPHVSLVPGLAITLLVVGFNRLGDGLNDALNPRVR